MIQISLLVLSTVLMGPGADGRPGVKSLADTAILRDCLVVLNNEAEVAAPEAAPLRTVMVREGDQVAKDQPLVQLDDNRTRRQFEAAEAKYKAAREEAKQDINKRFAKAAEDVAQAQVQVGEAANQRVPGAITPSQMREWALEVVKYRLQAEQADVKQYTDGLEAEVRKAEMKVAEEDLTGGWSAPRWMGSSSRYTSTRGNGCGRRETAARGADGSPADRGLSQRRRILPSRVAGPPGDRQRRPGARPAGEVRRQGGLRQPAGRGHGGEFRMRVEVLQPQGKRPMAAPARGARRK